MNEVKKMGGVISGVCILVDRSNVSIKLHQNQFSIIELQAVSYHPDNVPDSLKKIPVHIPGCR